jgi:hypothetical protein
MAAACWASLTILAGRMATLYALNWCKNRKQIKKLVVESTEEPIAGQLA